MGPAPLLQCITQRIYLLSQTIGCIEPCRMLFLKRLLEAAMWAPHHGPPSGQFVVFGCKSIAEMQLMTPAMCDAHWRDVGWASGKHGEEECYLSLRKMFENANKAQYHTLWPSSCGIMRAPSASASGHAPCRICISRRVGLACFWSSWHAAARESDEMRLFLGYGNRGSMLGVLRSCRL